MSQAIAVYGVMKLSGFLHDLDMSGIQKLTFVSLTLRIFNCLLRFHEKLNSPRFGEIMGLCTTGVVGC